MFKIYAPYIPKEEFIMVFNFKDICNEIISFELSNENEELFIALHDIDVKPYSIKNIARRYKKETGDLGLLMVVSAIKRYAELTKIEYFNNDGYRIKITKLIEMFEKVAIED